MTDYTEADYVFGREVGPEGVAEQKRVMRAGREFIIDEHGTWWDVECTCGGVIGEPCPVCNPTATP